MSCRINHVLLYMQVISGTSCFMKSFLVTSMRGKICYKLIEKVSSERVFYQQTLYSIHMASIYRNLMCFEWMTNPLKENLTWARSRYALLKMLMLKNLMYSHHKMSVWTLFSQLLPQMEFNTFLPSVSQPPIQSLFSEILESTFC
jgi:hypothetical protein